MASKSNVTNQPAQQQGKKQLPFKGYIRCEISKPEVADFKAWAAQNDDAAVFDLWVKLADNGYRLALGEKEQGMMASCTNVEADEATRGYVLTAFGRDATAALQALCYKHYVKLAADWGQGDDPDDFHVR